MFNTKMEPEMRISAFHVLIESILSIPHWTLSKNEEVPLPRGFPVDRVGTGEMLLSSIAQRMNSEPNLHVKSFVYSTFKSIARSKAEQFKFLARVVRTSIKYMTPVRKGIYFYI